MSQRSRPDIDALKEPVHSANAAGLRYVSDTMPGIARELGGNCFRYRYPIGELVGDEQVLKRIKSLAIPPAWKEVWICPDPCGHLQATGRDQRRRKQHRYHPRWREIRDETKYAHMIAFAKALPKIRSKVRKDLGLPGLPRAKVLATVVRLLEVSLIRVGNEEYAKQNDSFGLTTMRNRHAHVRGTTIRFRFRGKSGKWHDVDVRDEGLAKVIKNCQELPGQELFEYIDENGERQDVKSSDVNEYLREITGEDFTAKDFRTWAGTVLASVALREIEGWSNRLEAKKNLVRAIESVAQKLGNTPAVCRKCYVHPEIVNSYMDGSLVETLKVRARKEFRKGAKGLRPEERDVLKLLEQRLERAGPVWQLSA